MTASQNLTAPKHALIQRRRARERAIRATKRELAAAQRLYDANPTPESQAEVANLKLKLRRQQEGMREFIREANAKCKPGAEVLKRQPRREWAGDMPKKAKVTMRSDAAMASSGGTKWPVEGKRRML